MRGVSITGIGGQYHRNKQLIYTPHKMTPIHLVLVGFAPFNEGLFFFKNTFFLNPQKDFLFFLMLFGSMRVDFCCSPTTSPPKTRGASFSLTRLLLIEGGYR